MSMMRDRLRDLVSRPRRTDAVAGRSDPVAADRGDRRLVQMADGGWVLPPGPTQGARPAWTLVGTVDSPGATVVDPRGLVTPFGGGNGWSLDWWVGADDRWHLPAQEPGVRQRLIGDAPVVETLLRIPGGDAVHRAFGIRGATFPGGDEYVVVEVENRSSVPFALAWAIRPLTTEHSTAVGRIDLRPADATTGREQASAVMVDGAPVVLFPRHPARAAGSSLAGGDVAHVVLAGAASTPPAEPGWWTVASCPDGSASAAFIFPVPHTATVRCVIPLGVRTGRWPSPDVVEQAPRRGVGRSAEPKVTVDHAPAYPPVIPSAEQVAAGWNLHAERGSRLSLPDPKLEALVAASRRSLLLAPWEDGLRHRGPPRGRRPDRGSELRDTARIVGALDRAGHHEQAVRTLAAWVARLDDLRPAGRRHGMVTGAVDAARTDAAVIEAVATHRLLAGDQALFDDLLPDVVACVERLRKTSDARDGSGRGAAHRALARLAAALAAAGQPDAATRLAEAEATVPSSAPKPATEPDQAGAADHRPLDVIAALEETLDCLAAGDPAALDHLAVVVAAASATRALPGAREGHDLVASALLLDTVRELLVGDQDGGLTLLRLFPPDWYGGALDVGDQPTAHGSLSYALRWHGERPALLWELDQPDDVGAASVVITVPGLDPTWSTTQLRGEALLQPVRPPAGLGPVRLVAEHPDIDPSMRRPGAASPADPFIPPADGGTFT